MGIRFVVGVVRRVPGETLCEVEVGDIPALRTLFLIDPFFSVEESSLAVAVSICDGVTPEDKVLVCSNETTAGFGLVLGFVTALGFVLGFEETGFGLGFAVVVVVVDDGDELAVIDGAVVVGGRLDGTICPCKPSLVLSLTTVAPRLCTGTWVKFAAFELETGDPCSSEFSCESSMIITVLIRVNE